MYRGTTPRLTFAFPDNVDLSVMSEIWVTIKSLSHKETFKMSEGKVTIEDRLVVLELTQEDTLNFTSGLAKIQIRMLTNNDESLCSTIKELQIKDVLENGVIS